MSINDQPADLTSSVWKRFKRHRGAIGGTIILAVLILLIILSVMAQKVSTPFQNNRVIRMVPGGVLLLLGIFGFIQYLAY